MSISYHLRKILSIVFFIFISINYKNVKKWQISHLIFVQFLYEMMLRDRFHSDMMYKKESGDNYMKVLHEGLLANFLNKLMDLILLSVLWFLTSLPVFTLGASACAVYDVSMRCAFRDEPPIVRTFFSSFKKNFKKGTALFFIFFSAGAFIALDLWAALRWDVSGKLVIIFVILSVCYFYFALLSYAFPVLAYFDTGVKESIKKSFFLSMSNGAFTVFVMAANLMPVLLILLLPFYFGQILFFYFAIGFSGIAFLNSICLARLFDPERVKESRRLGE